MYDTTSEQTPFPTLERLRSRSRELSTLKEFESWNREIQSAIEAAQSTDDATLESLVQLKHDVYPKWVRSRWSDESQEVAVG
ncbi:MAG: hypothetical protein IIB03_09215 [Acidobacteria bacterium]|nr:hypothetical protein [Acidobacteriota bacterium]